LTYSDAGVERLRSGVDSGPSRPEIDRQVALSWTRVKCSPCSWRAQRRLRKLDLGRWPP